jgi:hypothetical protein
MYQLTEADKREGVHGLHVAGDLGTLFVKKFIQYLGSLSGKKFPSHMLSLF